MVFADNSPSLSNQQQSEGGDKMGGFKPRRGGITDASEANYRALSCNDIGINELLR